MLPADLFKDFFVAIIIAEQITVSLYEPQDPKPLSSWFIPVVLLPKQMVLKLVYKMLRGRETL